ncbi:MAG: hypothetical protein ACTHLW_02235 [Verrucomicrobiota bacterium]
MARQSTLTSWFKKDKEQQRFYLFAGMGGRAARRKHRIFLQWSVAIGLVVSAAFATVLYLLNQ